MQLRGVLRGELILQRRHELVRAHAWLIVLIHDFIADVHVDTVRELLECRVKRLGRPLRLTENTSAECCPRPQVAGSEPSLPITA